MSRFVPLLIGLFVSAPGLTPLTAQPTAEFRGRVLDAASRGGIADATIAVTTSGASARTDSLGRFRIPGLKPGIHRFMVSAPGFARGSVVLAFAAKEEMERDLELEPLAAAGSPVAAPDSADRDRRRAQQLAAVPVTADALGSRRFLDFERRRNTGRGQYLTRGALDSLQVYTLQDALRSLRGIRFNCAGGSCTAQMVRAPLGCSPEYVVDERVDNMFGPLIPIRDIQGIEVYSGVSDVPGEFAGRNSGCGVIVIWTTAGREPRRK